MKPLHKGLAIALIHALLVLALGAKLLVDRARYPRVWVKTMSYDPDLPIRGRYVRLRLVAEAPKSAERYATPVQNFARLEVRDGKLFAVPGNGDALVTLAADDQQASAILREPVAFFLPEGVPDPSRRQTGEELWAEVTIPRKGPPRPIRLGVKKDGQDIVPLAIN